jgi:hypothetical protein
MIDEKEKPVPPPYPPFPKEELPTTDELDDVPPLPSSGRLTQPLPRPDEEGEASQ